MIALLSLPIPHRCQNSRQADEKVLGLRSDSTPFSEGEKPLKFRKLHGAGNDFVVMPVTEADLGKDWAETARQVCAQHTGVGADGLVLYAPLGRQTDVLGVSCINADGSTATMCGNALRVTAWCVAQQHSITRMDLLMAGTSHQAQVEADQVWVTAEVGDVQLRCVQTAIDHRVLWFDAAHTGTEHVVAVTRNVESLDVESLGRLVRRHPKLAPVGANVNFVERIGAQALKIRTYERGVEAETLSCGSGAVAAVVIARRRGILPGGNETVSVHNRSATPLLVRTDARENTYWVGGPVTPTFEGVLA
ncbi:diaminopimelate epimerase [Streptomyces albus]|uniref:diaminopimelate epimerase n=1 Tax=Streptomyces albus TaxID=1888 RepID=UPI0037032E52